MKFFRYRSSPLLGCAMLVLAGCFVAPTTVAPPDDRVRTIIPIPYDLAWDAVNRVVENRGLRVGAQDENHGIIEAEGGRFTAQDADCGFIKSIAGMYPAEPSQNSTSVYSILIRPHGPEATSVTVAASFTSGVRVPMHPSYDVDCVSRGTDESTILKEVVAQARKTHRPSEGAASAPPQTPPASVAPSQKIDDSRSDTSIYKPGIPH